MGYCHRGIKAHFMGRMGRGEIKEELREHFELA